MDSAPAVVPWVFSRLTAMSLSPPPHIDPCDRKLRCADSVATPPTIGLLPIARS